MNKSKKIAAAVVSLVLASSMCLSVAACSKTYVQDGALEVQTDESGNLTYKEGTTLSMNVGYNTSNDMNIAYTSANFSGTVTLPDGNSYAAGSLKPAWKALSETLGINFTDSYTNLSAAAQVDTNVTNGSINGYNVLTAQSSSIVNAAKVDESLFLDLSLYLDYMPNYKKFLEDNPIVYMSLINDVDTGAMYYAPYFDGNDDIEKYEIAKKNWVTTILDGTTPSSDTISFATSVTAKIEGTTDDKGETVTKGVGTTYGLTGTSASVESYMGTTGSWSIASTDPNTTTSTVTITVNYTDALNAATDGTTPLGKAYADAVGSTYTGTSGNIVDIQNAAINATKGAITGAQLTEILKAYIDVAYQDKDGNKYYTNRADVFNGYDAAWDVDLLVAFMRCVVTYGGTNLGTDSANVDIYGLTGRKANSQRESDLYSLAGELYGVRGFTSRYNFTYIDADGALQDNRADEDSYDALARMHTLVQEGLINVTGNQSDGKTSYYTAAAVPESFMIYDYVQTQTANGGYSVMGIKEIKTLEDDYDFEPIVTPVSRWDDGTKSDSGYSYDEDGNKYMRFTESWRSVKNTGFAIPYQSVAGDSDKLAACLKFIDYFFSNDGQILMTFGGQSTTNSAKDSNGKETSTANVTSSDNGWWYGTEVTDKSISDYADLIGGQYYIKDEYAAQYFCFGNKLYTGTLYNGKQYPIMTNANLAFYYGYEVNGLSQNDSKFAASGVLSYTNYARRMIGSALPIGNKLQAFEFQCTSDQGINGGNIVAAGLVNGTISHVYQQVGSDNAKKSYWYTEVPTTLPYDTVTADWISENVSSTLDSKVFANSSSVSTNFYIDVIKYGLGNSNCTLTYVSSSQTMPDTSAACVKLLEDTYKMSTYEGYMQTAWKNILNYYTTKLK